MRIAADGEDAAERGGVGGDHARLQVAGGQPDAEPVDPAEGTQRDALVLDPVLRADQRQQVRGNAVADRPLPPLLQHGRRVLGLHREHEDVVGTEPQRVRAVHGRDVQGARALRGDQPQPALAQRGVVRAPGDQHDVVPALVQPSADRAAHGTRPDDDVAHAEIISAPAVPPPLRVTTATRFPGKREDGVFGASKRQLP